MRVFGNSMSTTAACVLLLKESVDEGLCPLLSAHVSGLNFMKPCRDLPCSQPLLFHIIRLDRDACQCPEHAIWCAW